MKEELGTFLICVCVVRKIGVGKPLLKLMQFGETYHNVWTIGKPDDQIYSSYPVSSSRCNFKPVKIKQNGPQREHGWSSSKGHRLESQVGQWDFSARVRPWTRRFTLIVPIIPWLPMWGKGTWRKNWIQWRYALAAWLVEILVVTLTCVLSG
jgi:hypothetical protein